MDTYSINNKKYNINFDIQFDSFYNFLESLKDSKKFYHDYCNKENINTQDFDTEYINTINILKSELLKSYILITNDKDAEKYVIINETIKDLYNFMIEQFMQNIFETRYLHFNGYVDGSSLKILRTGGKGDSMDVFYTSEKMYLLENDKIFMSNIDINYLTKKSLSRLVDIYASNATRYNHFKGGFLQKMNIATTVIGTHPYYYDSCYKTTVSKFIDKYRHIK